MNAPRLGVYGGLDLSIRVELNFFRHKNNDTNKRKGYSLQKGFHCSKGSRVSKSGKLEG